MSNSNSHGTPAGTPPSQTPFSWLVDLASNRTKEIIVAAAFSSAGLVIWSAWGYLVETTKDFIIGTTIAEMSRDKNRFQEPLQKTFHSLRDTQVGTLSTGSFTLTDKNSAYLVWLYFPRKYKGQIFYRLKYIGDAKRDVLLLLPNGRTETLRPEAYTDISEYLKAGGSPGTPALSVVKSFGALNDLVGITFQLAQPGDGKDKSEVAVEVTYVAFVAPTIPRSDIEIVGKDSEGN